MNGKIEIESEPGKGSLFYFTARFGTPTTLAPRESNGYRFPDQRVLVVDDNATNRAIVADTLQSWAMVVETAVNGFEALVAMRRGAAEERHFQLAIVDADMPGLDGPALAHAIRSDPALPRTLLLLMSPVGEDAAFAARRREDFNGWLTKPMRPSRLYESLAAVLKSEWPSAEWPGREVVSRSPQIERFATDQSRGQIRILVVDDNLVNLKVAEKQLQHLGYRVDLADSGSDALDAPSSRYYPVVLLDCEMPDMDGYETTAEIRRREGGLRHTIVVAMTAHALEGARLRCLNAGMDEYVAKPVTLQALAAVLERCATLPKKGTEAASTNGGA